MPGSTTSTGCSNRPAGASAAIAAPATNSSATTAATPAAMARQQSVQMPASSLRREFCSIENRILAALHLGRRGRNSNLDYDRQCPFEIVSRMISQGQMEYSLEPA